MKSVIVKSIICLCMTLGRYAFWHCSGSRRNSEKLMAADLDLLEV